VPIETANPAEDRRPTDSRQIPEAAAGQASGSGFHVGDLRAGLLASLMEESVTYKLALAPESETAYAPRAPFS